MSTLWTPDGERPIRRAPQPPSAEAASQAPAGPPGEGSRPPSRGGTGEPAGSDDAEMIAHLEALRQQLVEAPAEAVIANHAHGLFELAAVHLSVQPPNLDQARLSIDALAALVEGLKGRLGEAEAQLEAGLGQLRMAFVQIRGASQPGAGPGE